MATVKVKLRPSSVPGQPGTVYYQVIHNRMIKQITTSYRIRTSEWSEQRNMIDVDYQSVRKSFLLSVRECIRSDVERLDRIIRKKTYSGKVFTVDDIVAEFRRNGTEYSMLDFMEAQIVRLKGNGKLRTSETYRQALNSFRRFLHEKSFESGIDSEDIMLDELTTVIMEAYEAWLKSNGNVPNTVSFYLRILRAVYNRAVEQEMTMDRKPFRHVYTGVDKTVKRALPIDVIRKIKTIDLSLTPKIDFARDMFMLSFYFRGMSFIDMAFLKKENLCKGYLVYRRQKTGQKIRIAWTSEMQAILDKYEPNPTDYLLPIITSTSINPRNAYRNNSYSINHSLKIIGEKLKLSMPLTFYCSRHSWASAAKCKGISLSVISEALGHDSESTTAIYLASLDSSAVDKANQIILRSL